MRKSSNGLFISLLIVVAVWFFAIFLFQKGWLVAVQRMLNSNRDGGLPVSTTPVSGFSFPTATAPVSKGTEVVTGTVGITVTRVISPADGYVGDAAFPSVRQEGKQYLVVDINVRCLSTEENCRLTEFDFGVETQSGKDYPAELSLSYSSMKGLFEGGEIKPGKSMKGSLIFIIAKGENGLTLVYPRMFAFGSAAKFDLGK